MNVKTVCNLVGTVGLVGSLVGFVHNSVFLMGYGLGAMNGALVIRSYVMRSLTGGWLSKKEPEV